MRRRNEVAVGIFVTIGILMLVLGIIWMARGGFATGYPLYTRFNWGENLTDGQAVRIAGVNVGYVDDFTLGPGYIDVRLAITEKRFKIPRGTVATITPVGIFGDVEVTLTPPLPLPTASYSSGDTIPSGPAPPSIGVVLSRVDSIGRSLDRITRALDKELVEAGGIRDLRRTMAQLVTFGAELQRIATNQDKNATATMETFRHTAETFQESARRLGALVDSAAIDSTFKNLRSTSARVVSLSSELEASAAKIHAMVDRIDRGDGSIGRLLNDSTLVLRVEGSLTQVEELLADIRKNPSKYINIKICC